MARLDGDLYDLVMHLRLSPERRGPAAIVAIAIVAVGAAVALAGSGVFASAAVSPSAATSPAPTGSPVASDMATAAATPTAPPTPTTAPKPTETPTAAPAQPSLPSLLAAIGDSYSQAYSVSPQYRYDHPEFSWVVGTAARDGVQSLLERFRALGASPAVVDAATSGRKMSDAPRQASLVVAAAKKLGPGETAYVTFELGTNDLCDVLITEPAAFEQQLATAMTTLRTGLPAGSRILMLALPDFPHFHEMTQADAATRAALLLPKNSNRCPPYLGTYGSATTESSNYYLTKYDDILKAACDLVNAGATPHRLTCTYDVSKLAESDFTATDLSTYDYFHPSLTGQAKMAESAWQADVWSATTSP